VKDPFDLLVSTGRGLEMRCISDLHSILSPGFPAFRARKSPFSGLVKAWVGEKREAVRVLAETLETEPWFNDVIKRAVPIDRVVPTEAKAIVLAAREIASLSPPGPADKFRVRVRKRGAHIDRMELIRSLAEIFDNPVDLENPDFEVRIEVVRGETGVSIIRRGEIFPDL